MNISQRREGEKIMDFGANLKKLRKEKNVTQQQLADVLCVDKTSISKWENGFNYPNQNIQLMIADYFGVTVDYLLGRDDTPSPTLTNAYVPDAIVPFEVLGTIKAGYGGAVEEYSTGEYITIPIEMLAGRPASDYFVLQVRGNSMYPKILDGDRVLVLRTDSVDSGTTAVVIYNGDEATIKKVIYNPGENWVDLVPNNPEYDKRRIFANELDQFRIIGKAVKLIRDI